MNRVGRRLFLPTLSSTVMLVLLLGLGSWQLERLAWKRGLLSQISQAETRPAVVLPDAPTPFAKVSATGVMRNDLPALYGAEVRETHAGPQLGAQLLVPLERPGRATVLVDRGWVPMSRSRRLAPAEGQVTVEGYVRTAEHAGLFSAPDDLATREFYTLDPAVIGAALGLGPIAPFTLIALGPPPPEGYPDPARHLPRPPNDHLSYAITWFGLALTLVVIFAIYARKVTRP